jgi:hypothetical protein
MDQKQVCQKSKLCNGKVTSHNSLHPLLSTNSNSNVGSLDHADIIGPITNAQSYLLGIIFYQGGDLQTTNSTEASELEEDYH